MSKKLESLLTIAPLLNKFILDDVGILVTDTEKVLAYYPGQKLVFEIEEGDLINDNWVINEALRSKERVVTEVDASVCGIPYIGVSNPIFNDTGEVVGGITISQPTDRKEKLLDVSRKLLTSAEVVTNQVENISIEGDKMIETGDELNGISKETEVKVRNTDDILKIIKDISKKIRMIGMNASIEAARVGEVGKGFAIVAKEVQKLAAQSAESTSSIEDTLKQVSEVTTQLNMVVKKINRISNEQTDDIKEIYSQIQTLTALGNDVVQMAESLSEDIYEE